MDQERWNWSIFRQQGLAAKQGADNSSEAGTKIDRYKHDMEQAIAMKSSKISRGFHELTKDDVVLGMNGLDHARACKERNELNSALKVYESSLELLIKILGSKQPIIFPDQFTRLVVEASVHAGLSEAELIKKALQKQTTFEPTSERSITSRKTANEKKNRSKMIDGRSVGVVRPRNSSHIINSSQQSIHTQDVAKVGKKAECSAAGNETRQTILQDFYVSPHNLQKCTWDDISGLQQVKQSLQEAAILPLIRPDLFTGLRKPRNTLLYGPPGTGKTILVKAVANESGSSLFVVTSSALTSKWMGESEKLVKSLFQIAQELAPSIIFIDEMDALLSARKSDGEHEASRRLKTEFMVNIDGVVQQNEGNRDSQNVLLLACTNCPWDIDSAVMRRFSRRIYVPLPDKEARKALIKYLLTNKMDHHSISAKDITTIVRRTEGFSCSDINAIASEAAFGPIRSLPINKIKEAKSNEMRPIDISDFDLAFEIVTKSVNSDLVKKYDDWNKQQQAIS